MLQQMTPMKRFTPVGRKQAERLVNEINQAGGQAKIGETWLDCGAGIAWETVLIYSKSLSMWYQGLTPNNFDAINRGEKPRHHDDIVQQATR